MEENNDFITSLINNWCVKICSIKKEENEVKVYDCNGKKCGYDKQEPNNRELNCKLNQQYLEYRKSKGNIQNKDYSVVWIMVIEEEGKKKRVFQVGQNSSLGKMYRNDLNKDRSIIIFYKSYLNSTGRRKKYSEIFCSADNIVVSIYEVCIDEILKAYKVEFACDGNEKMCYYIKSMYVEGMIAYKTSAEVWKSSGGLDGMAYEYYEELYQKK